MKIFILDGTVQYTPRDQSGPGMSPFHQ